MSDKPVPGAWLHTERGLEDGHMEQRSSRKPVGRGSISSAVRRACSRSNISREEQQDLRFGYVSLPGTQTNKANRKRGVRPQGTWGSLGWVGEGVEKGGEKGWSIHWWRKRQYKEGDKHHPAHNFIQGHFWSQCEFNIESVLFHIEYLAKPLKSVSEYLKIIHWRGRLLAFNNATVQRCSFLVLFMALDLSVEFSLSSVKISKSNPTEKDKHCNWVSPPTHHTAARRLAVSLGEERQKRD